MSKVSSEEELLEDDVQSLLLQGKFKECCDACSTYFEKKLNGLKSQFQPVISFQDNQLTQPHFQLCLLYLQCLYEMGSEGVDKHLELIESFLGRNSPVPFVVAVTWIQLIIQLGFYEKAKLLLTTYLNALAKEVHQSKTPSDEMFDKYALLANLYTVHTLPKLGQISNAKKFLAMHNSGSLLNESQRLKISHALDKFCCTEESTKPDPESASESKQEPETEGQQQSAAPESSSAATNSMKVKAAEEDDSKGELVVPIEHAIGALCGVVVLVTVVAKRDSLRQYFRRNVNSIGDKIFGS